MTKSIKSRQPDKPKAPPRPDRSIDQARKAINDSFKASAEHPEAVMLTIYEYAAILHANKHDMHPTDYVERVQAKR